MQKSLIAVAALFLCSAVSAQEIVLPKPNVREFRIESGLLAAAWTADAITTHNAFARCSGCFEGGYFFYHSRSTPKIMGSWLAADVAGVVLAYEWKQHVRNKYLHPLWRAPLFFQIYSHGFAAYHNTGVR